MFEGDADESSVMLEDTVLPSRATVLQHQSNRAKQPESGNVAIPAVIRAGGQGPSSYEVRSMPDEQSLSTRSMSHTGHQPPMGHQAQMCNFTAGQKALMKNVTDGHEKIRVVVEDMSETADLIPDLGNDPVS